MATLRPRIKRRTAGPLPTARARLAAIEAANCAEEHWATLQAAWDERWLGYLQQQRITAGSFIDMVRRTVAAFEGQGNFRPLCLLPYYRIVVRDANVSVAVLVEICRWGARLNRADRKTWWGGGWLDAYYVMVERNLLPAEVDQLRPYCFQAEVARDTLFERFLETAPTNPQLWQNARASLLQAGLDPLVTESEDEADDATNQPVAPSFYLYS